MLKNYFKVAVRSFWRDKTFSVINLFGLAIGLAAVIIIIGYVRYEFSYDTHYSNAENVYRIQSRDGEERELRSITLGGTGLMLAKDFPEIAAYTYAFNGSEQFKTQKGPLEIKTINGSADFFKVFNLPIIAGDKVTPLTQPNTMVLTKSAAEKFYPGENPIGKIMTANWGGQYTVTAVINNIPHNTHFQADAIVSVEGTDMVETQAELVEGALVQQYILLKPGVHANVLAGKFPAFSKRYGRDKYSSLELFNVKNIHLYSHTADELQPGSDIKYIYIFSIAGLLILTIAVINYINLATARSVKRTLEIGIRKVLGAAKRQLIFQFLAESLIFFFISLLLAIALAQICWPYFEGRIANTGTVLQLFSISSAYILIAITLIGGFMGGIFPAFILARVKPALSVKGVFNSKVNVGFRKALVVFQFVISGVLVIATVVVQKQLHFISSAKLGFKKEQLIMLPFLRGGHNNINAFKQELTKNTSVKSITVSNINVGTGFYDVSKLHGNPNKKKDTVQQAGLQFLKGDVDMLKAFQLSLVDGRDFSSLNGNDILDTDTLTDYYINPHKYDHLYARKSIILNQTAVKQLGLINPVGQQLVYKGLPRGIIIGVVKDFNISSMYQKVPGMVLSCQHNNYYGQTYVRIAPGNISQTLDFIGNKWKLFYPNEMYNFSFVDDKLQHLYVAEQTLGSLFGVFAAIAILIACFGLFGLVSLTVQQRVREIGIRKVLGATVSSIVGLLSADLLKLVMLAVIIASPIAWWSMSKWLQNFAYRTEIPWWIFALTAIAAALTAFLTISYLTLKAATANPVKSLRSE